MLLPHLSVVLFTGSLCLSGCTALQPCTSEYCEQTAPANQHTPDIAVQTPDQQTDVLVNATEPEKPMTTKKQNTHHLTVAAISLNDDTVTASVVSHGCTRSEDFHIDYAASEGVCQATLVRDRQDFCRRAPFQIAVTLPWQPPKNCTKLPVIFLNPIDQTQGPIKRTPTEKTLSD